MNRQAKHVVLCSGLVFFGLLAGLAWAADQPPARVASFRAGAFLIQKEVRSPAKRAAKVFGGTDLLTDAYGRMSVLLPDHLLLKLAEKTEFLYQGVSGQGKRGRLKAGKVWLRGRKRSNFQMSTPTATAAIRGTEWYVEVKADGTTTVGVIDGAVEVANELGSLTLGPREVALVEPGKPPLKAAYLTPANAVNWTLNYRGYWDESDYRRAGAGLLPIIKRAVNDFEAYDLAAAFEQLNRARAVAPDNPAVLALAGFLQTVSGRADSAAGYLDRAAQADRSWGLPLAQLSLAALTENDLPKAERLAREALKRQPDSVVGLIALAYAQKAELELAKAHETAKQAVLKSPRFQPARLVAGTIALEMDDLKTCRKMIDFQGQKLNEAERLTLAGYLALRESAYGRAMDDFTKAVAFDPDRAEAVLGLGLALFNVGKSAAGLEAIINAGLIAPQVSAYQSYLAKAYFEVGRRAEARHALARSKRLDPKDPTPFLYEALFDFDEHKPGLAARALEQARKLNKYRAVFRSRFLLDQDQAVLMANTAKIYDQLGFNQAVTQLASQALELNPTNESAHRRLYYALIYDPRLYDQAAMSELFLSRFLAPPTRQGVSFDESDLSPYQQMFDQPGFDGILAANQFHYDGHNTTNDQTTVTAAVAAKVSAPLAFYVQASPSYNKVETNSRTRLDYGSSATETTVDLDSEGWNQFYESFFKWRPNPAVDLFGQARMWRPDSETTTKVDSTTTVGGQVVSEMHSKSETDFNSLMGDFDLGGRVHLGRQTQLFLHASYRVDTVDSTSTNWDDYSPDGLKSKNDSDGAQTIGQGALWHRWGKHFSQIGVRYFGRDYDYESGTVGDYGTTTYETHENSYFLSGFLMDQYNPTDKITLWGGLFLDNSRYEDRDDRTYDQLNLNPVIGATFRPSPSWRLRAAYIQNTVGERSERLQPVMVAGFPIFRVSQLDAYSDAQLLNLTHKGVHAGLDYKLPAYPLFAGLEGSYERAEAKGFAADGSGGMVPMNNDIAAVGAYLESLLCSNMSGGLAWRLTDTDLPDERIENRFTARLGWFLDNGLSVRLTGYYDHYEPNEAQFYHREHIWAVEPEIKWRLFRNSIRLSVVGHWEDRTHENADDDGSDDHDASWWVRAGLEWHF